MTHREAALILAQAAKANIDDRHADNESRAKASVQAQIAQVEAIIALADVVERMANLFDPDRGK